MRKRLLSSLFFLLAGGMTMGLHAQTDVRIISDVTSKVQNADFSADEPIMQLIRTYDYDMTDAGVGAGGTEMFGQQPVTGWTAANPTDNTKVSESNSNARTDGLNARAAGIFALLSDADDPATAGRLGGEYYAPNKELSAEKGIYGPVLGMVAVWGADVKYTQPITLPAGDYMMLVTMQNTAGGSAMLNSNMGFVPDEGEATYSTKTELLAGEWETDTILFRLTAETSGALSLGYKSGNYGSGGAYHLFIDNVKLYTIETNVLDQKAIDEAKAKLLEVIKVGEDREADTSAAQQVYDNPNATLEEVLAAIDAQKEINEQAITDLSAFFIKNAHFSLDDPIEDGITTYDYDMPDPKGANGKAVAHYSMQPVTGWTASHLSDNTLQEGRGDNDPNGRASGVLAIGSDAFLGGGAFKAPPTMSDGTEEGKLLGFLSVWSKMSQYTQRVSLPAGKYTLTFSYYNVGGNGAVSKNLMGFVADDGTEYLGQTTTFTANKWLQESVKFEIYEPTAGYFTMGYTAANAGSGSMPHLFVDGVSLNYVGTGINASLFALSAAIATGEEALDKEFYPELKEQLQQAVETAQDLLDNVSDDDEANTAAADVISNLISDVNANIAAYERLERFFDNDLSVAVEKYDADNYPELNETLTSMQDEVADAKNDFSWTTAQINDYIAAFTPMLKAEVQKMFDAAIASGEKLNADLDISILFNQMGYTYSTAAVSGGNVPDKEWKYGNASNFKTQYGTAEVWNQSPFEVSRTLADMPAGKYTITTKAFYRTADNETNYANYDEANPTAFVFAGNVKTPLANVVEIANRDGAEFEGWTAISEGEVYVPNSQKAAYDIFNDDQYESLEKSVSTALVDAGDLTFGVKGDQMESNSWVVWYTFSVAYNALDNDAVNDELQGLIDQASAVLNGEEPIFVNKADADLNEAITQGETARDGDSLDEKKAAMQALKDAIAYTAEGRTLLNDLTTQFNYFNDLKMNFPDIVSADENLDNLFEQAEGQFETNEDVKALTEAFPGAWFNYVLGQDMTGASVDQPVDISGVLINPAFDAANANYWQFVAAVDTLEDGTKDRIGQNQGYQSNNVYTNEDGSIEINQFIEAWRPDGAVLHDGVIGNTLLAALPQGYYRLAADVFATNQKEVPEEGITGIYLLAQTESGNRTTAITSTSADNFFVDFYSDGKSIYTVGLLVSGTTASWTAADNFFLYYVGSEPTDAIQGVEATANNGSGVIYNLAGQRVSKAVRGLYIIDGKKVIK